MSTVARIRQACHLDRPWWIDVCTYYGVCPRTALALGTRATGRRPLAFGGRTFEEIWASASRETPEQIVEFYRDLGPWLVFRQIVRHRWRSWGQIAADAMRASAERPFVEFGCGIAPVAFYIAQRPWYRRVPLMILMDIPSEPLRFAEWRLSRLRPRRRNWIVLPVEQPIPAATVITCLEVLEHVPDPVATGERLLNALTTGGILWEDFIWRDDAPHAGDLATAHEARPAFYAMLRERARLTWGHAPEHPNGGGMRRWVKR